MNNVVLVQLKLAHPNPTSAEAEQGIDISLIFDGQPSADDVYHAFCEIPTINRSKDFGAYSNRLRNCLDTYGVPKLGKFSMVTPEGAPVEAPMVYATWRLNLISPSASALGVWVGSIRISRRNVHTVDTNAGLGLLEESEPESTDVMTALRKARLDPTRKTPKNRKVKKEQQ